MQKLENIEAFFGKWFEIIRLFDSNTIVFI